MLFTSIFFLKNSVWFISKDDQEQVDPWKKMNMNTSSHRQLQQEKLKPNLKNSSAYKKF